VKGDWLIAIVAGVAGFALVSWLLSLMRQQKAPPVPIQHSPVASSARRGRLSLAALGAEWHRLLGVAPGASAAEIQAAYHARLAECDAARFAAGASEEQKAQALQRRADAEDAYEFIRPLRS
jgi:hypothetical protein